MFLVITSNLFNFHAFLPDSRPKGCTSIVPASGAQRQPSIAVWCRVLSAQAPGTTGVTPAWCLIFRYHWHPRNLLLTPQVHKFILLHHWCLEIAFCNPSSSLSPKHSLKNSPWKLLFLCPASASPGCCCTDHASTDSLPFQLKKGDCRCLAFWELSLACDNLQAGREKSQTEYPVQCFNIWRGSQTSPSLTLHGLEYSPISSGLLNACLTFQGWLCQLIKHWGKRKTFGDSSLSSGKHAELVRDSSILN